MSPYDREAVLASLRSQKIAIADLKAKLSGWPRRINPYLDTLHRDVEAWLERYGAIPVYREVIITG